MSYNCITKEILKYFDKIEGNIMELECDTNEEAHIKYTNISSYIRRNYLEKLYGVSRSKNVVVIKKVDLGG